ncbi:MAG: hypothetical protein K0B87_00175 [Candidatus Syntrophosphaera sp.]|nr:hypothetical protein [Candidatus Syntrophosphaera sp.]
MFDVIADTTPTPKAARTSRSRLNLLPGLIFSLIFVARIGLLAAQSNQAEYDLVKTFKLPQAAVPLSELNQKEEVYMKDGTPFTGIAYERFENKRLARLLSLYKGLQHGPMYLWYPDGSPQMSANYRQGRLNGRFLGWYRHGGVIYDMVINQTGYAGDYVSDDETRRLTEGADSEGDGDARESSQGE